MAKQSNVPGFVRWGNMLTTTLLRAGVRLAGFGYPMYLLTVRGRKSGQPRTVPIVIIDSTPAARAASNAALNVPFRAKLSRCVCVSINPIGSTYHSPSQIQSAVTLAQIRHQMPRR